MPVLFLWSCRWLRSVIFVSGVRCYCLQTLHRCAPVFSSPFSRLVGATVRGAGIPIAKARESVCKSGSYFQNKALAKKNNFPTMCDSWFVLPCVRNKKRRKDRHIFRVYKTYRKWLMLSHNMRVFVLYFEDHISSLPLVCHACSKQLNGPFGLMRCTYAISWENAHPLLLPVGKSSTCRRWSQQTGLAIPQKNSFPIMPFSLLMWSTEIFIQTVCCHRNTTNRRANCWPVAADTCISAAICRKNWVFE